MPKCVYLGFFSIVWLKDALMFTVVLLLTKWPLSSHPNQATRSSFSVSFLINPRFLAKIMAAWINFDEN